MTGCGVEMEYPLGLGKQKIIIKYGKCVFWCIHVLHPASTQQIQDHKLNGGAPTYLAVKETSKDIHFEPASGRLYITLPFVEHDVQATLLYATQP